MKTLSTTEKIYIAAFMAIVLTISIFIIPNLGSFNFILG